MADRDTLAALQLGLPTAIALFVLGVVVAAIAVLVVPAAGLATVEETLPTVLNLLQLWTVALTTLAIPGSLQRLVPTISSSPASGLTWSPRSVFAAGIELLALGTGLFGYLLLVLFTDVGPRLSPTTIGRSLGVHSIAGLKGPAGLGLLLLAGVFVVFAAIVRE